MAPIPAAPWSSPHGLSPLTLWRRWKRRHRNTFYPIYFDFDGGFWREREVGTGRLLRSFCWQVTISLFVFEYCRFVDKEEVYVMGERWSAPIRVIKSFYWVWNRRALGKVNG